MNYTEENCFFEVNGKEYWAGGAIVNENLCIAYLAKDGRLNNWKGEQIGTYKIIRTWNTPKSYVSSRQHQVEAVVDGITYTGRSAGIGMMYKGKRKKSK